MYPMIIIQRYVPSWQNSILILSYESTVFLEVNYAAVSGRKNDLALNRPWVLLADYKQFGTTSCTSPANDSLGLERSWKEVSESDISTAEWTCQITTTLAIYHKRLSHWCQIPSRHLSTLNLAVGWPPTSRTPLTWQTRTSDQVFLAFRAETLQIPTLSCVHSI